MRFVHFYFTLLFLCCRTPEDKIVSEGSQQEVYIGSTVELACNAADSGVSRYEWSRDRGDIPPTAFKVGNKLELVNVQPGDAGRYICKVYTLKGAITQQHVLLKVQSKPQRPNYYSQRRRSLPTTN